MTSREEKQQVFIRVCRDSGFRLEAVSAATLAATALRCSPLEIWTAVGSLDTMDAIANGSHPAANRTLGA